MFRLYGGNLLGVVERENSVGPNPVLGNLLPGTELEVSLAFVRLNFGMGLPQENPAALLIISNDLLAARYLATRVVVMHLKVEA